MGLYNNYCDTDGLLFPMKNNFAVFLFYDYSFFKINLHYTMANTSGPPPDMFARYTGYENTRFGKFPITFVEFWCIKYPLVNNWEFVNRLS